MPELPEVETVRRGIEAAGLEGPVREVWRSDDRLRIGRAWAREREGLAALRGARPGGIDRRGKYLLWDFVQRSGRPTCLLLHLGMSGRCAVVSGDAAPAPHTHLRLGFGDGRELRFVDPRRFGGLRVAPRARLERDEPLAALGPEPFDPAFDGAWLHQRLGRSRRALRDALLDQGVVAGIGNIYANEALFVARLHPLEHGARLGAAAFTRLAEALRVVLDEAIHEGGTSLRDYRDVSGGSGRMQARLRVYGRAGEPCRDCGAPLRAFTSQGRSGCFCPRHQRRRPERPGDAAGVTRRRGGRAAATGRGARGS
ncbi:MAG: bifunctional DNA-formamidopyrimidine glycosylase/DNA-(apurinic or apyrimidinic site) lyase [Planctomycetota bacterium]